MTPVRSIARPGPDAGQPPRQAASVTSEEPPECRLDCASDQGARVAACGASPAARRPWPGEGPIAVPATRKGGRRRCERPVPPCSEARALRHRSQHPGEQVSRGAARGDGQATVLARTRRDLRAGPHLARRRSRPLAGAGEGALCFPCGACSAADRRHAVRIPRPRGVGAPCSGARTSRRSRALGSALCHASGRRTIAVRTPAPMGSGPERAAPGAEGRRPRTRVSGCRPRQPRAKTTNRRGSGPAPARRRESSQARASQRSRARHEGAGSGGRQTRAETASKAYIAPPRGCEGRVRSAGQGGGCRTGAGDSHSCQRASGACAAAAGPCPRDLVGPAGPNGPAKQCGKPKASPRSAQRQSGRAGQVGPGGGSIVTGARRTGGTTATAGRAGRDHDHSKGQFWHAPDRSLRVSSPAPGRRQPLGAGRTQPGSPRAMAQAARAGGARKQSAGAAPAGGTGATRSERQTGGGDASVLFGGRPL